MKRLLMMAAILLAHTVAAAAPLKVVCSVPELGALAREIGGDRVAVTVCVKPREDPHALDARPSLIRELAQADAWVQVGMELEVGWAPVLLTKSRNSKLRFDKPGFIDCASVITAPHRHGPVDRSAGDVHPAGNPHYLLDPVNGLLVAELLAERFTALAPDATDAIAGRMAAFRTALGAAMVGPDLASVYPAEKLAVLATAGTLSEFLRASNETRQLGGWLGRLAPIRGRELVADHDVWLYFTQRFGLSIDVYLEPKPGMAPTTRHLATCVKAVKGRSIPVLITSPYFAARHHTFMVRATGIRLAPLAHQVGARPQTDSYIAWIDYNVETLAAVLAEGK